MLLFLYSLKIMTYLFLRYVLMIVNNLSYQVNGKNIIDDVSFVLSNKNKVGLVGENGSGKTTLLKILSSKLKDYTGNVNNESETIAYLKQEIEKNIMI